MVATDGFAYCPRDEHAGSANDIPAEGDATGRPTHRIR